jgi:hypothetical protein
MHRIPKQRKYFGKYEECGSKYLLSLGGDSNPIQSNSNPIQSARVRRISKLTRDASTATCITSSDAMPYAKRHFTCNWSLDVRLSIWLTENPCRHVCRNHHWPRRNQQNPTVSWPRQVSNCNPELFFLQIDGRGENPPPGWYIDDWLLNSHLITNTILSLLVLRV